MEARVLLMEPDSHMRRVRLEALEAAGFSVRTAEDPTSAVAGASDGWPDIAVLNLSSPRVEAMDLLWRMTRLERPVPVIISDPPPAWGERLTDWVAESFSQQSPQLRQAMDAAVRAMDKCAGFGLLTLV